MNLIFCFFLLFSCIANSGEFLPQRPDLNEQFVEVTFDDIAAKTVDGTDRWIFNGEETKYFAEFYNEDKVLDYLVDVNNNAEDIYILDIGAGKGERLRGIAEYIARKKFNKRFHLINIRGEEYIGSEIEELGKSVLYNFGHVRIENLDQELARLGFANVKFSLVLCRWTFPHLTDPLRVFAIVLSRIDVQGLMLMDTFQIPTSLTPYSSLMSAWEFNSLFTVLHKADCDFVCVLKIGSANRFPFIIRPRENTKIRFNYDAAYNFTPWDVKYNLASSYYNLPRSGYNIGGLKLWRNLLDFEAQINNALNGKLNKVNRALSPSMDFYRDLQKYSILTSTFELLHLNAGE